MTNKELYNFTGKCLALDEHPEYSNKIIKHCQSRLIDWDKFVKLCSNNLILQVIYLKFKSHDLLYYLPNDLAEHLKEIHDLNVIRNKQILYQIDKITSTLNQNNINPIYLKGAGNLLDDLYSSIGERILGDIDFLVPEADYLRAATILQNSGYLKVNKTYKYEVIEEMKHYPRLYHPDYVSVIEIHRIPVNSEQLSWFNSEQINHEKKAVKLNAKCSVLSDNHKIIHNFIHSQLINEGYLYSKASLRDIFDLFLLSKRYSLSESIKSIKPKQKAIAYFNLTKVTLGLGNSFFRKKNISSAFLQIRHTFNLNSVIYNKISGSIIFISQRIFLGYIGHLIRALFSKKSRNYIRRRVEDRNWYDDHIKLYSRFFKTRN